jgi:hypothetical protein
LIFILDDNSHLYLISPPLREILRSSSLLYISSPLHFVPFSNSPTSKMPPKKQQQPQQPLRKQPPRAAKSQQKQQTPTPPKPKPKPKPKPTPRKTKVPTPRKTKAPAAPKTKTPAAPKTKAPAAPKTKAPAAPKTKAPAAPKTKATTPRKTKAPTLPKQKRTAGRTAGDAQKPAVCDITSVAPEPVVGDGAEEGYTAQSQAEITVTPADLERQFPGELGEIVPTREEEMWETVEVKPRKPTKAQLRARAAAARRAAAAAKRAAAQATKVTGKRPREEEDAEVDEAASPAKRQKTAEQEPAQPAGPTIITRRKACPKRSLGELLFKEFDDSLGRLPPVRRAPRTRRTAWAALAAEAGVQKAGPKPRTTRTALKAMAAAEEAA